MIILKAILAIAMVLTIPVVEILKREKIIKNSKKTSSSLIASEYVLIMAFILCCSVITIPTGSTGVRIVFKQIQSDTLTAGIHLKKPFIESVIKVNNKQQDITIEDKVWAETKSRTAIYFKNITVTYRILPEKSTWVYTNVSNYRKELISNELVASAVKSASKTFTDEDATNRSKIEASVVKYLQVSVDEKYEKGVVKINKVVISDADFEESYNKAVANKQKAQLEAEKQEINNKKSVDKAKAEAEVKRIESQAKADSEKIIAKGEAEANAIIQKSLTDKILKEKYIEKWNGQLPKVVTDSDSSILLQP